MADNIDKLISSIDELIDNIFDNTNSIKEGCNILEICSKEFVSAVDKLVKSVSITNNGNTKETQSNEEIINIDTVLSILGFAEITLPKLMDELATVIIALLSEGISIPSLLLTIGSFLISNPIGMEIGLSIIDEVEAWVIDNLGQGVADVIGAAISLITFTGLGAAIGGGPVGAIVGFIVGVIANGLYLDEEKTIANLLEIVSFDTTRALMNNMHKSFGAIADSDGFLDIGLNIIKGIASGLLSAMVFLVEPIVDLFTCITEGICNMFGINSPAKEMIPIGEYILLGIVQGFINAFSAWTESIGIFWDEQIQPWFTIERWEEFGENIKNGLAEKWTEFTEWWKNTGLYVWWEEDVAPWFTKEQWNGFGENIKTGLGEKWTEFAMWWETTGLYNWWNKDVKPWFDKDKWTWSGIKDGLEQAFNNAINIVKQIWNGFACWLNDKLTISWDAFSVGDYEIIPAGTFKLGEIPTFYDGGFPEDSTLFFAGEYGVPEMLGTVGGRTAVASGTEITGIADAVYSTGQAETSLLTAAVNLLQEIASKDMSINIGDREIARANYRGQKSLGTRLITEF